MRKTYQSYTNTALDADGIAAGVAYSGGGYPLSADGPGDNLAHQITITGLAATDHSGKTFTVTGTDANGDPLSEGIAGPNGAVAVTTTRYFATVTSVTVSATTGADTFNIGWNANAVGANIYLDLARSPVINAEVFCRVPSGSPTYSIEYTADDTPGGTDDTTSWLTHPTITGKSATFDGQITSAVVAIRLKMSAAGPVNLTVVEPYHA